MGTTPSLSLLSSDWMSLGASSAMAFESSLWRPRISVADSPVADGMAGDERFSGESVEVKW